MVNAGLEERNKVIRKMEQMFRQRKYRVIRFFAIGKEWHCVFFDQRDAYAQFQNTHWKGGTHIHYLSYLMTSRGAEEIWALLHDRNAKLPKSIHIKYSGERHPEEEP